METVVSEQSKVAGRVPKKRTLPAMIFILQEEE